MGVFSPDLYASIQKSNPETARVTETFVRAAEEVRASVASGDRDAFARVFEHVHDFFGDFTERAMEQSSFLIDRLVERD